MMTQNADKKRNQIQMFCMDDMVPRDRLLRMIQNTIDWSENHFNSSGFLKLLSQKAPQISSCKKIPYEELRAYLPYRKVEDADKIYFCGWNDHIRDKRKAHNFDKTEFYLGKTVADYCRQHNISSLWTDIKRDEMSLTNPWEI